MNTVIINKYGKNSCDTISNELVIPVMICASLIKHISSYMDDLVFTNFVEEEVRQYEKLGYVVSRQTIHELFDMLFDMLVECGATCGNNPTVNEDDLRYGIDVQIEGDSNISTKSVNFMFYIITFLSFLRKRGLDIDPHIIESGLKSHSVTFKAKMWQFLKQVKDKEIDMTKRKKMLTERPKTESKEKTGKTSIKLGATEHFINKFGKICKN